jgi:P27 family predicted phage terminase small subunit
MRGRKPKPRKLKLLTDNTDKRLISNAPVPSGEVPNPPDWLSEVAKEEWQRVAPELTNRGLLTPLDTGTLATYCETYSLWRGAQSTIAKEGATYESGDLVKKNPATGIAQQAVRDLAMLARELGLVPTARQRLGVEDDAVEDDLLQEFLTNRSS